MNNEIASEFFRYHPTVNFVYYTAVIVFSMILMNPICIAISIIAALSYMLICFDIKTVLTRIAFSVPFVMITALINAAFNHEGATVIVYLPSGNPLTAESILYGSAAAMMLLSVFFHFSGFNKTLTSDKIMYLFGRISPNLALVMTLTLRFVPRFSQQIKRVREARGAVFGGEKTGIIQRAKEGMSVLSIMITWCLENSIETADSMKSRGCGLKGRTAYSLFAFKRRDAAALLYISVLSAMIIFSIINNYLYFRYFPTVSAADMNIEKALFISAYAALLFMPALIEIKEVMVWRKLKSKI